MTISSTTQRSSTNRKRRPYKEDDRRRMLCRAAAMTAVTLLAGCGAQAQAPPKDLEWLANARGVVEQLRADVIAVSAYDRPAAARVGLRDESQLYGLLV